MGCVPCKTETTTVIVIRESDNKGALVDKVVRDTGMDRDYAQKLHTLFFGVSSSGRMEPQEFIAMFLALHDQEPTNTHLVKFLARLYLVFDSDGSGFIVFEEFAKFMAVISEGTSVERLGVIFRLCDTDKSGSIDRAEFLGTFQVRSEGLQSLAAFIPGEVNITGLALMAIANEAFDKMNLLGTGEVSPGEFVTALLLNNEDENLKTVIGLLFSALVRVVTGNPPIPKTLKLLQISLNF